MQDRLSALQANPSDSLLASMPLHKFLQRLIFLQQEDLNELVRSSGQLNAPGLT
jgi:hypothetical protein